MSDLFKVGETLTCLTTITRRDGLSRVVKGDKVKIIQVFTFDYRNKKCQDIMIQKDNRKPMTVLVQDGLFSRE